MKIELSPTITRYAVYNFEQFQYNSIQKQPGISEESKDCWNWILHLSLPLSLSLSAREKSDSSSKAARTARTKNYWDSKITGNITAAKTNGFADSPIGGHLCKYSRTRLETQASRMRERSEIFGVQFYGTDSPWSLHPVATLRVLSFKNDPSCGPISTAKFISRNPVRSSGRYLHLLASHER